MASFRLLYVLFISIIVCFQLTTAQECYECSGIHCNSNNSKIVSCSSGTCFILTVNVTNSYRSCYKPGGYLVAECNKYRFSSCYVCIGRLCNDLSLVQKDVPQISCLSCPKGVCGPTVTVRALRKCPHFRFPELPRCYSIVDRFINQYTFGCANEMTLEQRKLCDYDWFHSVCKYCDTPNCNTVFFRGEVPRSLQCLTYVVGEMQAIWCKPRNNVFPYHGCYIENIDTTPARHGCLSDRYPTPEDPRYQDLMVSTTMLVCFEDLCNKKFDPETVGLTSCGSVFCGTKFDSAALCAHYMYSDENDKLISETFCMGRFPCWRSDICRAPCYYEKKAGKINENCVNDFMYCYTCEDCPTVTANSPYLIRSCATTVHSCLTVSVGGRIFRGCNQDQMEERCERDKTNCEVCRSPSCNKESYTLSCHHCTPFNPMCAYTQQDTFALPCKEEPESIGDKFECYSLRTYSGQVHRGCVKAQEPCPMNVTDCKRCNTNFCNAESYVEADCIHCKGGFTSDCAKNVHYLATSKPVISCRVAYETPHCYMSMQDGKTVNRGCVADRDYYELMQFTCREWEDCMFCDGNNCNYFGFNMVV